MTLQVNNRQLPVIRTPNYQDLTWDVEIEKIPLVVGNASNEMLRTVTLKEFLSNFNDYVHTPVHGVGSLLADRDSHVLMSAQACFLPIPAQGEVRLFVSVFNLLGLILFLNSLPSMLLCTITNLRLATQPS